MPSKDVDTVRRDVPVGVPLDLSTATGMSCIFHIIIVEKQLIKHDILTHCLTCNFRHMSKYRVLLVAFQLLRYEKLMSRKKTVSS